MNLLPGRFPTTEMGSTATAGILHTGIRTCAINVISLITLSLPSQQTIQSINNESKLERLGRTYLQLVRMPVVMGMDPREIIAFSGFWTVAGLLICLWVTGKSSKSFYITFSSVHLCRNRYLLSIIGTLGCQTPMFWFPLPFPCFKYACIEHPTPRC